MVWCLGQNTTLASMCVWVCLRYFYFINSFSLSMYLLYMCAVREKRIIKTHLIHFFLSLSLSARNTLIFIFNVKILLNVWLPTHTPTHTLAMCSCIVLRRMLWRRGIQIGRAQRLHAFSGPYNAWCIKYVWISCPSPTTWTAYTNKHTMHERKKNKKQEKPDAFLSFLFFSFIFAFNFLFPAHFPMQMCMEKITRKNSRK